MKRRNKAEGIIEEPPSLEDVGIITDGTCYWVVDALRPEALRRQIGPITEKRGQNGYTAEQLRLIAADAAQRESNA